MEGSSGSRASQPAHSGTLIVRVRRVAAAGLRLASGLLSGLARRLYDYDRIERPELARWMADSGDRTLRLMYTGLSTDSCVIDAGGYEGNWASDIYAMYRCKIHIFEPVPEFAEAIRRRFGLNPDITVHQTAIANTSGTMMLSVAADGSSMHRRGSEQVSVTTIGAADFFEQAGLSTVDLMKINIEGAEYDLLEHMLATGLAARVRNMQIQFHRFVPDAERRMRTIQQQLSTTHRLTYQYTFVWENWALRQ